LGLDEVGVRETPLTPPVPLAPETLPFSCTPISIGARSVEPYKLFFLDT
jgi:hypothetical protein